MTSSPEPSSTRRVWLISGCSSGFGRALAQRLLARGDTVVATARQVDTLADLVPGHTAHVLTLTLDVTQPASVRDAVAQTLARFGRIDVLVNNAGYSMQGALEDVSDAQLRAVFDANVFRPMDLTRAVLPAMRAQGAGQVVNLSSVVGRVSWPLLGPYSATKYAVECLSEALAAEVAGFGIRVSLIEPGAYATDFVTRSMRAAPPSAPYLPLTEHVMGAMSQMQFGDPQEVVSAICQAVDQADSPLRVPVGPHTVPTLRAHLQAQLDALNALPAAC